MGRRKGFVLIFSFCALLILILGSSTAQRGMEEGIRLCLYTLLPALFPFLVICAMITGNLPGTVSAVLSPIGKFCRIPAGNEGIFLVGILGGYPVGAQNAAVAYRSRNLSLCDAGRMAIFCSNAGPAFIFGILGSVFPDPVYPWLLWLIQILSALICGILIPGGSRQPSASTCGNNLSLPEAMQTGIKSMTGICASVVLFRTVTEFLFQLPFGDLPGVFSVLFSGFLELTNGCILLVRIQDVTIRFLAASGMLAFGGLSVWLQTLTVCRELDLRWYLPGKLLQTLIALILCPVFLYLHKQRYPIPCTLVLVLILILFAVAGRRKKEVAI